MTTKNNGPYFVDQDGDTGIIGPGIHAEAPDGCALFDALEGAIHDAADDASDSDELLDLLQDALTDHLPALMNLAYAEGAPIHDDTSVYLCSEVDAIIQSHAQELSERDRREGELLADVERLQQDNSREYVSSMEREVDTMRLELGDARAELATLRQQLREVTEWTLPSPLPEFFRCLALIVYSDQPDSEESWIEVRWIEWTDESYWIEHYSGSKVPTSRIRRFAPLPPLPKEVERG